MGKHRHRTDQQQRRNNRGNDHGVAPPVGSRIASVSKNSIRPRIGLDPIMRRLCAWMLVNKTNDAKGFSLGVLLVGFARIIPVG